MHALDISNKLKGHNYWKNIELVHPTKNNSNDPKHLNFNKN
jgi:hypothetical protein